MANRYFGAFHQYGYTIWHYDEKGQLVQDYQAGNCRYDSGQTLPPGPDTVDLATMEEYCEQTGKEICAEHGGEWTGTQHDTDTEAEIAAVVHD